MRAASTSSVYTSASPYEEAEEEQARQQRVVSSSAQQQQQQQQSSQQQQPSDVHPVLLLRVLLPQPVACSSGVQYLLTEKLVLGQQR